MRDLSGFRLEPVVKPATYGAREDLAFTEAVISQTGPNTNPRVAELFAAFTRHMHTFIRETKITSPEMAIVMEMVDKAAKDGQLMLLGGPMGLGVLLDKNTFKVDQSNAYAPPTTYTALGPFWRPGAPLREMGASVVDKSSRDDRLMRIHGRVLDHKTGMPVPNAELDIWQASTTGFYDHEDPDQPEWNLRGRFKSSKDGAYSLVCLRPTPYPVPTQGWVGEIYRVLDRHPMRTGHIHFKIVAQEYLPLVTELYDEEDPYLASDAIFDVHESLIMRHEKKQDNQESDYYAEIEYDFKLVSTAVETPGLLATKEWVETVLKPF